jgi:hypothetical protein
MIKPEDDSFHDRTDSPYWNESGIFIFNVPERKLEGICYFWHRPNMNLSGSEISIWDPSGEFKHDIRFYEYEPYSQLPGGTDTFDFRLDSGMWCSLSEPLTSYRFGYKGDGCEIDLACDAVTPPYEPLNPGDQAAATSEVEGFADVKAAPTAGRYQQGGHFYGTINLDGDTINVDCMGFRDHTWGPREPVGRWKRFGIGNCYTESGGFDVWCVSELPPDTDPIVGTTERAVMGAYIKDGQVGHIVSGEHRAVERGPDGRALRVELQATDTLGRELQAVGTCENWYWWHGYRTMLDIFSLTRWEFDGQVAYGDHEDAWTLRQNHRLQRELRAKA